MPDVKFDRDPTRFNCLGIDVNRPVDSVKEQKFVYLQNMRSYQYGRIEPRLGLADLGAPVASETPVHSCRRLNDPAAAAYTRVIGTGTHLAHGATSPYTDVDFGYSGEPLALVPWRPDQSPTAYMYVADRLKMRKLSRTGVLDTIGYARPDTVPDVALDVPYYKEVSGFDATGWTADGDATGGLAQATTPRINPGTTIAGLLYDSGNTGWGCCWPSDAAGFGPGERLLVDAGGSDEEPVTVQSVHPGSASTNISAVIYDSGSTGPCSVVLTTPLEQVAVDALLLNTTLPELARIVGVVRGPDGNVSVRLDTAGNWAAGHGVEVKPSFRAYFAEHHPTGHSLSNLALSKQFIHSTGTGTLTLSGALDLSYIDPIAGVSTHDDDYMHIAFRVSRPDLITEIRCQLDVDASVNDFTRNYYMRAFRASDIAAALHGTQSLVDARATVIQRTVIESDIESAPPEGSQTSVRGETGDTRPLDEITTPSNADSSTSQQLETGENVWFDMRFRIGELIRVGTDDTRTLQHVAAIRITVLFTDDLTLDMDSWWIGGGYGPDTGNVTAIPYRYRYRARNPATGARSNWSPETRLEVSPWRQRVLVTPSLYTPPTPSLTTSDFVLDIQRFGGEIPVWHYVGFTANTASPSFADKFGDDVVAGNDAEPNINYQPWPIIGVPVSGTTGTVAGTSVDGSGFSPLWAAGTIILINGIAYTLYRVLSTTRLELVENAGSQSAVSWRIDEPIILGQPLPCLWGDEQIGAMFACGDPINPGRLYFSNGNNPDSTVETNYVDITSPSEPLMNGVVYNQRSYVFSSERMFQILRSDTAWVAQEIPNGLGLFARWAITRNPSPAIFFLGKDGIYATTGGEPVSLTDNDLFPLFPAEGTMGDPTNGVSAPSISAAVQQYLRLECYDGYLYFDYVDTFGNRGSLVNLLEFGGSNGGWYFDTYTPGVAMHYGEEGPNVHALLVGGADATTGRLYQYGGDSDNGTPIVCGVRTPARDQGDARSNKLYGDILLDADTQGVPVTCTPYINNYSAPLPPTVVTTASRLQTAIPVGTTSWTTARNLGLELTFTVSTAARPEFYLWEIRYTFEAAPISAASWQISPTSYGMANWKHYGLFRIAHVSTTSFTVSVIIDGVAQPLITVPASGGIYTQDVFRVPVWKFKLSSIRLAGTGGAEFRLDGRDSFFQVKEWGSDGPYQDLHVFGDYSFVEG